MYNKDQMEISLALRRISFSVFFNP